MTAALHRLARVADSGSMKCQSFAPVDGYGCATNGRIVVACRGLQVVEEEGANLQRHVARMLRGWPTAPATATTTAGALRAWAGAPLWDTPIRDTVAASVCGSGPVRLAQVARLLDAFGEDVADDDCVDILVDRSGKGPRANPLGLRSGDWLGLVLPVAPHHPRHLFAKEFKA